MRKGIGSGRLTEFCGRCLDIVRGKYLAILFAGFVLGLASGTSAADTTEPPSEYQLKAAVIFNFTKFIEWPDSAFAGPDTPYKIGVIGENPFEDELEKVVRDKKLGGRAFIVKQIKAVADVKTCHMLFISQSERKRLQEILKAAERGSVLTISELDRFMQSGGMIHFVMEGNKVRFEINDDAAKKAGLRISSKLLNLARRDRPNTK